MEVASLSGGLDSSVMYLFLTGYLRGGPKAGDIKGVFADPGKEDPRTYHMLEVLEAMTNKDIAKVRGPTWEEGLEANAWFLPWYRARWCTRVFKIRPFEAFIGQKHVVSHIGLRADEPERTGYLGGRGSNITPRYILREMGMTRADVEREAKRAGLPETGEWSCGCCPFKNIYLQVKMIETQPEMAEWMAWVENEKQERGAGGYTWIKGYTMRELIDNPSTRAAIRTRYWRRHHAKEQLPLWPSPAPEEAACLMCQVK